MGDTVVKGVKDLTIWLGEVTVLPSDTSSYLDRLKYGLYKSTLKKIEPQKKIGDSETGDSGSENSKDFQELHPGLAKIFKPARRRKHTKRLRNAGERLAKDFEEEEKIAEKEAEDKDDTVSHDDHHYRRELLEQIRKVYADASASEPKHYTYKEWAYFLKLLGEDESDRRFHKRAPVHPKAGEEVPHDSEGTGQDFRHATQEDATTPSQSATQNDNGDQEITQWSWLGQSSPLMGDKDEPEWVLERLFAKLEESMKLAATEIDEHRRRFSTAVGSTKHGDARHEEEKPEANPLEGASEKRE